MRLKGIDEIAGNNRIAVGPLGIVAQGEGVGLAVVGNFPVRRHTRNDLAIGAIGNQTLVKIAQDMRLVGCGGLVLIQGFRVGRVAAVVDHLCNRSNRCGSHQGSRQALSHAWT